MLAYRMVLRAAGIALLASLLLQAQTTPSSNTEVTNPAAASPEAPPLVNCPAGGPLGAVDLRVLSPKKDDPLTFRTIVHLTEGDTLSYAPVLIGSQKRPGEIALVMLQAKQHPGEGPLMVTDPKPADKPEEWKIPETLSLAAFVYGPQGLSKRKVRGFLSQDELLVAQLADYAEKTTQTEALVEALSNSESSSASVNAALTGFASQYGLAVQLDKSAPASVQAQTLFATMNPQLASYNPLASSTAQRAGQTASLATAAASLFFGSPVGLAAGGTAMLLDLRAIAFPDTQFRTSFAQSMPGSGLNLCGQRDPAPPHTRVAFIWASRIPNVATPSIRIGSAAFVPLTQKSAVPVDVADPQWKYLQRARNWTLENDKGQKTSVNVLKLGNQRALEIDLEKANLAPGDYHLSAFWDWTPFQATGPVHVRALSDFKNALLEPASQDRLVAKSGKIPITLQGTDFEFVDKVEMKKLGDEFAMPQPVRFLLPKGLREGPQDHMDVQIDTAELDPGRYELLVSQQDGKSHAVNFKVLPNPPQIDNLPILANQGATTQHYVLKGQRLELLSKLEAPVAQLELGATNATQTERNITVQLKSSPEAGRTLPIKAYLEDRSEPLTLAEALQITGPLPVIASSKLSPPSGMAISIHPDEFPAGYTLTAMLDVKNLQPDSVLRVACSGDVGAHTSLHIGEQTATSSLQQLSPDQLFLSLDTSALPAGCSLQAVIDSGNTGKSQPFTLAHIIRMPQIDSFDLTNGPQTNGMRMYTLTGRNLEMIGKTGWTQSDGIDVPDLPSAIPGQGQRQSLQITLADAPRPNATLCIWLRGEKDGRSTTVAAPAGTPVKIPEPQITIPSNTPLPVPASALPTNPAPPPQGALPPPK
jgi:hypothetical protein